MEVVHGCSGPPGLKESEESTGEAVLLHVSVTFSRRTTYFGDNIRAQDERGKSQYDGLWRHGDGQGVVEGHCNDFVESFVPSERCGADSQYWPASGQVFITVKNGVSVSSEGVWSTKLGYTVAALSVSLARKVHSASTCCKLTLLQRRQDQSIPTVWPPMPPIHIRNTYCMGRHSAGLKTPWVPCISPLPAPERSCSLWLTRTRRNLDKSCQYIMLELKY